ncbi:hypothetical protein AgCh_012397 [Apium graveolens]
MRLIMTLQSDLKYKKTKMIRILQSSNPGQSSRATGNKDKKWDEKKNDDKKRGEEKKKEINQRVKAVGANGQVNDTNIHLSDVSSDVGQVIDSAKICKVAEPEKDVLNLSQHQTEMLEKKEEVVVLDRKSTVAEEVGVEKPMKLKMTFRATLSISMIDLLQLLYPPGFILTD